MVRLLALVAALWPGWASALECRLALLLALDVSSSVDEAEYALQREGVAAALLSDSVQGAILQGAGHVALGVYEWSGRRQSHVVLDWVMLRSASDIKAAAARIAAAQRSYRRFPTAMGYAMGFGATMMGRAPLCERQVIDVSGDGVSNDGFGPRLAYKHFAFREITVNGLAVLGADPMVEDYFDFEVLHGPGAFLETSDGYDGYRQAMERKLYREIQDRIVGEALGRAGERG
ncbi:DUF1194 domain-containing protein [Tropicibacter naphthalenivorans]|uniref:DUF1194 domain-containing protein n=1 Tax=Tropicibacter naphthalenivorans TaxID=441103 RepID=UPI00071DFB90|nr:DUF1194 domain-containing protein [Tropicibacter naphthalenivorans]